MDNEMIFDDDDDRDLIDSIDVEPVFNRRGLESAIQFKVPGQPFGKQRPRFCRSGRVYTPKETIDQERKVAACAHKAMISARIPKMVGAIEIELWIYCKIPASWPKYKKELAQNETMFCLSKPDGDNVEKLVLDAMNKVVYDDDAQVVKSSRVKIYSDNPRLIVIVREINGFISAPGDSNDSE